MNNTVFSGYQSAEARWSKFGPYYAMFPIGFVEDTLKEYSKEGDYVLDPFAGRFSTIYIGSVLKRFSLGIEINPVGWVYGSTKLDPADKKDVIKKSENIYKNRLKQETGLKNLPEFYHYCFSTDVLLYLLNARSTLEWRENKADRTLMSFLLVYLHGKLGEGLSNQMRMTKSMGMNYSIKWWKEKGFSKPPNLNPHEFILKKIEWRYKKGLPKTTASMALLGDSTVLLESINHKEKFDLLFTSPPYQGLTDYYYDQWLRLWLLGSEPIPEYKKNKYKRRFNNKDSYKELLEQVFSKSSRIMKKRSVIYVRTDSRNFTLDTTIEVLKKYFPRHKVRIQDKPYHKKTQTQLHGNKSKKNGEVDVILTY